MVHKTHTEVAPIAPSMVRSVFGQLKSNGYTHSQIIALSHGLSEMADQCEREVADPGVKTRAVCQPAPGLGALTFEYDLSQLGCL